jgi:predicted permease
MIKNYIKIAWRNIKRHKGFSLINAGGLTLGMASCLMLLLYVSYHRNFDSQFKGLDKVYMVENNQQADGKVYTFAATPGLMAPVIKTQVPGVDGAIRMAYNAAGGLISSKEENFKKDGSFTDPGFFSIFPYHFLQGSPATALTQPNSIVITEDLAKTLFGNANALNKVLLRNNQTKLVVTGVVENPPLNSTYKFDYLLPWAIYEQESSWIKTSGWGNNFCQTIVKLKEGADFNRADGIIRQMINKNQNGYKAEAMLFPFSKLHLYSKFENGKSVGGMIEQINMFTILAICILLIACINFMNLSTARSEERSKEVGIRKAIGSNRGSLMAQFITESVMLSLLSMLAAVAVLFICIPAFNNLLNIHLALPAQQWRFWVVILLLAFATGFISGSYPAFYLSAFNPISVLKGKFSTNKSGLPLRKVLVVLQFAFAVFLISATICIYRQIKFIQSKPVGYDKGSLVQITVEGNMGQMADVLINEMKSKDLISHATILSANITQNYNNTWGIEWPGKPKDAKILFDVFHFGYDFIATSGVKLVAGREFSPQYPGDTTGKSVMINESAARVMNLKEPIGAQIKWGDQPMTVVGVYRDFVWGSPYEKTAPMISMYTKGGSLMALRLSANKSIAYNIEQIQQTLKKFNPAYPPVVKFVEADFEKKYQNEKTLGVLANLFGGLAIVISCLGLFGLAAYAAEQRTKEIGVRKVLGATVGNLVGMLSMDFIKLVVVAIVIAIPLSVYALNKWLQNYEYRINLSWWILALAGAITIMIAVLTVSFQAIKAALANPVNSLRSE